MHEKMSYFKGIPLATGEPAEAEYGRAPTLAQIQYRQTRFRSDRVSAISHIRRHVDNHREGPIKESAPGFTTKISEDRRRVWRATFRNVLLNKGCSQKWANVTVLW